jgi:xylose isomerase
MLTTKRFITQVVASQIKGDDLEKANKLNIEFNRGIEAGHAMSLTFNSTNQFNSINQLNCPSGNSKEFCSGWKSATQFTLQQYKSGLTAVSF